MYPEIRTEYSIALSNTQRITRSRNIHHCIAVSKVACNNLYINRQEKKFLTTTCNEILPSVDVKKVYYILDPNNDLPNTRKRLQVPLDILTKVFGWKGITGTLVNTNHLKYILQKYSLLIYCGHNGGEQFWSMEDIKNISSNCSV
uniref:separase n=1 Tax=Lygus hesperus TaxID=30085 RepID=A0A0A9ZAE1_LYGHE